MSFIMNLKPSSLASFLFKAEEKQTKDTIWDIWLVKYQHMDKESYISFDEFYKQSTTPPDDKESDMETSEFVEQSFKYFKEKVG